MMLRRSCLLVMLLSGCEEPALIAIDGTHARLDFTRSTGFWSAPFPDDSLLNFSTGRPVLPRFPNPDGIGLVEQSLTLVEGGALGFALAGGVFFAFDAPLDASSLPQSLNESVASNASVFLAEVTPTGLLRHPIEVAFHEDSGPFGAPNMLSLIPLQGRPLKPNRLYVAVVLREVRSAGERLGAPLSLVQLMNEVQPEGMSEQAFSRYGKAVHALKQTGINDLAALTVFTTDDPTRGLKRVVEDLSSRALPTPDAFTLTDTFDEYCVFSSSLMLPVYQSGTPPYTTGGAWEFDEAGAPVLQTAALSRMVVTVPRRAAPDTGWPPGIFVRTGGGGDRPLIDRGWQPGAGQPSPQPGTGPAVQLTQAGFAGVQIDGPHGGPRNPGNADEQLLMFNITNPRALRDNLRQSAVELVLLSRLLDSLAFDSSTCPGASATTTFDTGKLVLTGHSMGATIAPLALAYEPRFRAVVLSGAGASYIENIMHKRHPLDVRPLAELLLGYFNYGRALTNHDPVLTLVQWAVEPSDAQVYAPLLTQGAAPPAVLMIEGVVDTYNPPRIANAVSLALALDQGLPERDTHDATLLPEHTPLGEVIHFAGRQQLELPLSNNRGGVTAVVVQHLEDGLQDGHEVFFQLDAAKRQYRCFLSSFLTGEARVPAETAGEDCL